MYDITPMEGHVTTHTRLNVRRERPSVSAPIARKLDAGETLAVRGMVSGDTVSGNSTWYAGDNRTYFWSGGCGPVVGLTGKPARFKRRPNGTILPLSVNELESVFGAFTYEEASGGAIRITDDWQSKNIVDLSHPALANTRLKAIEVHKKAKEPFVQAFDAIVEKGLHERIRTCGGTFVPRHKSWNPKRSLSSHSWGVAIDLNVQWNGYGAIPAPVGHIGSLRELVPHFEAAGFAWGGHFSEPDGMHFELARLDL